MLAELTRLLQEIQGAALLGRHCEEGVPQSGLTRPGLPGGQDASGGVPCPSEELERQRECLLQESGEVTNGLQAGLLAYAETAIDVNEQVKAATLSAFQGMEDALVQFVATQRARFAKDPDRANGLAESAGEDAVEVATWTALARVLLNLDEAITRG